MKKNKHELRLMNVLESYLSDTGGGWSITDGEYGIMVKQVLVLFEMEMKAQCKLCQVKGANRWQA